jgi:type I restriction enzyme S subunit
MSEWKECKLGDVAEIVPGFAFKSEHFGDKGMPVIKITDINPPYINIEDAQKVDLDSYNQNKLEKYYVSKGDFAVAMTGATIGKIGKNTTSVQAILNQRVAKIKPLTTVDHNFVYFTLLSNDFQ